MTSSVLRRQLTVEFGHCDPAGVILMARLFQYFDTSTWMLFEAAPEVKAQDFSERFGILPLVKVRAAIRKPVRFGDVIEIETRVAEFRRASFEIEHRITVDGQVAVEGAEIRVWAAVKKTVWTGSAPAPFPAKSSLALTDFRAGTAERRSAAFRAPKRKILPVKCKPVLTRHAALLTCSRAKPAAEA